MWGRQKKWRWPFRKADNFVDKHRVRGYWVSVWLKTEGVGDANPKIYRTAGAAIRLTEPKFDGAFQHFFLGLFLGMYATKSPWRALFYGPLMG